MKARSSSLSISSGGDSLESAMKAELKSFKKLAGPRPKPKAKIIEKSPEKIQITKEPENLGDILRDLGKIDQYIKASALVKLDGTILASINSSQISDSLIAVIATTVTTIAKDVIFSTESGDLKHITFSGTKGLVHIVPIVPEIFLVVHTGSSSKKGIIEVVGRHTEKKVKQYLNLD
jgi:predicted regulator of Ras-like GTPase activity (Roadblock/LC7/MglB family)